MNFTTFDVAKIKSSRLPVHKIVENGRIVFYYARIVF